MTTEQALKFLEDAATYFDKKVLETKEDRSYWAYVTNAEGLRQISDLIKEQKEAVDALVPVVETYVNPIQSTDIMFSMQYHNEWRNEGYKALTKAAALREKKQ